MIFCFEISTYVRLGKIMKMTALWRGLYLYIWHPRAKEPYQAPQNAALPRGRSIVTRRPSPVSGLEAVFQSAVAKSVLV